MNIKYEKNALTGETLAYMWNTIGWGNMSLHKAKTAIENTLYSIVAMENDTIVGIGRMIGDKAMVWYIQDLIVLPEYQGKGIGSVIMNNLIEYAKSNSIFNEEFQIGLMAAKEKEAFYQQLGFRSRPNEKEGSGMVMDIKCQL